MRTFCFVLLLVLPSFSVLAQRYQTTCSNLTEALSLGKPLAYQHSIRISGRSTPSDGFEGDFHYVPGDTTATNAGTVFAFQSGRLKRQFSGAVNVLWFGAKGDKTTDDTAAFLAARNYASNAQCSVFIPRGNPGYTISSVDWSGVPEVYGEGGWYREGTVLYHKLGATNNLFPLIANASLRPFIHGMTLKGRDEENLRNSRAITAVTSRTEFEVVSAPPVSSGHVFFYLNDGGYHYLGSALVASVTGTTVTISDQQDWFATPTAAGGLLTTDCVACFSESVTESGITVVDPTRAGYCAIDLVGLGGYLKIDNIRFEDWHTNIRIGAAVGLDAGTTFHCNQLFAGIYCPFPAGSDHRYGRMELGGSYQAQEGTTDTATPLTQEEYRRTKFGVFLSGTASYAEKLQLYTCIRPFFAYYARPFHVDLLDIGSSVREAVVIDNSSEVSVGAFWAYNSGTQVSNTPVVLNVNGNLDLGVVNTFLLSPHTNKAPVLVQSTTANAINRIHNLVSLAGCTNIETSYGGQSQLQWLSYTNTTSMSGPLNQRFYVWNDRSSYAGYGIGINGSGTNVADRFRLAFFAGSTNEGFHLNNIGYVGIGKTNASYKLDVGGDVAADTGVFAYVRLPSLTGALYPVAGDPNGIKLISTTNGLGNMCLAALFPDGRLEEFIDIDGIILGASAQLTGALTAGSVTAGTATFTDAGDVEVYENLDVWGNANVNGIYATNTVDTSVLSTRTEAIFTQLSGPRLAIINATSALTNIANAAGALVNDGAGALSYVPGITTNFTEAFPSWKTNTIQTSQGIITNIESTAATAIWDDSMIPEGQFRLGSSAPTLSAFNSGPAQVYFFDNNQDDAMWATLQFSHRYKESQARVYPHVHWTPTASTGAGNGVVWELQYAWTNIGSVYPAYSTALATNNVGSNWQHQTSTFYDADGVEGIAATGHNISSIMVLQVRRLASTSASDTYDQGVAFLGLDVHHEVDGLGSDSSDSKSF